MLRTALLDSPRLDAQGSSGLAGLVRAASLADLALIGPMRSFLRRCSAVGTLDLHRAIEEDC